MLTNCRENRRPELTQINSSPQVARYRSWKERGVPMRKKRSVWVVVADGAKAVFYTPNSELSGFQPAGPVIALSPAAKLQSRQLKSDRPGRTLSSARNGVRHAIEPKHDYHKLEKHRFTAELVDRLNRALTDNAFDDLIIVAPRRSLGEMRILMSDQVKARIQTELAKDLTHHSSDELWRKLATTVVPLVTRTRRKAA
jgi:protein required for attachment to host cells